MQVKPTLIAHADWGSAPKKRALAIACLSESEKYRDGIKDINMTPESLGSEYATAIRVKPERVRSF